MKTIYSIFLVVILAATTFGQTADKPPKGVDVRYDKFKDITTASVRSTSGLMSTMNITVVFMHAGNNIPASGGDFLISFRPTIRCRGFCFREANLIMLIANERMSIGHLQPLTDNAVFPVESGTLDRIARSDNVEYQVGTFEGRIDGDLQKKIRSLLDYAKID